MTARAIAVLRALPGVGDLLCAVPALRAVRRAHPQAKVTLAGLMQATWFVERYPDLVDDLLVVAGVAGLPEVAPDPDAAARFESGARARGFDLALQLHGSGVTSNAVAEALGARRTVVPSPYRDDLPEVRRMLAVTAAAGCPPAGDDIVLPIRPDEHAKAAALAGPVGPHVCLHPGASRPANRWPPERFAAVGDWMAASGHQVILTGTRRERPVTAAVAAAMEEPALDLAGRTTVGTLAAVFARARVVVSNDTGAAHVAAAVGTPSVVVFAPGGDAARWAPLDRTRHRPVAAGAGWPSPAAVLEAIP
jgi:ADP-heptose:LPS heptosyltransferase